MDFGRLGSIRDPESGRRRAVWALVVVWRYSRHCFVWPTRQPEAGRRDRGPGRGLVLLRGRAPLPRSSINFPAAVAGADALHPRLDPGLPRVRSATEASSPTRRACVIPATSRASSAASPTCASASSRAATSGTSSTCAPPPAAGAWRWRDSASTARPADGRSRSSGRRSSLCSLPGTASPTRSPTGGPPRSIPTTTSPARTRCTRCRSTACPQPPEGRGAQLGSKLVRIYHRGQLIKVHPRQRRGGRATDPNDYPAELTPYTRRASDWIQRRAAELGEAVGAYAERLLRGLPALGEAAAGPQAAPPRRALLPRPPRCRLPPRARGRPRRRAPPRAHPRRGPRPGEHPRPARAAAASGALRPLGLRLRPVPHADLDRSTTMTATTSDLRPLLKRLKLGRMLDTLPERIALARRDHLDYADFLQILLVDEVSRRDHGRLPAAVAPGRLRAALPPRGLRLGGRHPARPPPARRRLLAALPRSPRSPARRPRRRRQELLSPGARLLSRPLRTQRALRPGRPLLPRDGAGPRRPLGREGLPKLPRARPAHPRRPRAPSPQCAAVHRPLRAGHRAPPQLQLRHRPRTAPWRNGWVSSTTRSSATAPSTGSRTPATRS